MKDKFFLYPLSFLLCRIADADKIQIVEMDELDTQGFAEKRKEFRKIFSTKPLVR